MRTQWRPSGPRRSVWRRIVAPAVGVGLPISLVALGLAATWRPAWYQPAAVDYGRLREDKAALARLQDEISAALNSGWPAQFEIREDQLNRWIVARDQLWPEAGDEPAAWQDVQVELHGGVVRIGATVEYGGLRAVATLLCRASISGEGIEIYCDSCRLGLLPVPLGWLSSALAELQSEGDVLVSPLRGGTMLIRNDWVWPNGRRRCRLSEVRVVDGVATAVLEPWAADR